MIKLYQRFLFSSLLLILAGFSSCTDPNAVFDQNTEIGNRNWSYLNKIRYDVRIDDPAIPYNLYLNLRVSGDYKYSNLFVLISQGPVNSKQGTARYEFKLAKPDGEWLGKGTGNLYSFQLPFEKSYKFPAKGIYHFEVEQNMRDNPLHEVSDVGLRVEKAQ